MQYDIKLDKIGPPLATPAIQQKAKEAAAPTAQEGVVVTNHVSKLMNILTSDDHSPDEISRVSDMKQKIQSNAYKIDFGALSDKLLSSGVLGTR